MAERKKTSSKSTTKTTSSKKSCVWGLNKISFYTIGAVAILYLIATILSACDVSVMAVRVLQNIGTAIMVGIVAFLAWRYVSNKPMVWKVLYFVLLLVIVLGIILPLIIG